MRTGHIPFLVALVAVVACKGAPSGELASPSRVTQSAAHAAASDTTPTDAISRDSTDRCRWEGVAPRAHVGEVYPPRYWDRRAMMRGVPLRCELRDGGPAVRLMVRGDEYSIPRQVDVYSPAAARAATQTLAVDTEEPASERDRLLIGRDLNADGWTDLRVQTWTGSAGIFYDVFMWNPRSSRFEQDSVFPRGVNVFSFDGRPCAGEESRLSGREYCWVDGGWHYVRGWSLEERYTGDTAFYVRSTDWVNGGRVTRTQIDTLPERAVLEDPDVHKAPPVASPRKARR